ncbi:MAG: hypothetical protein AAGF11_16770 [Myxococcota bacterium]
MTGPQLSLPKRLAARALHTALQLTCGGSRLEVHEEAIVALGWRRFLELSQNAFLVLKMLKERYGEIDAQFIIGIAAMWNGCGYCGYGHALTGALLTFRDHGRLHPLDPHVLAELLPLESDDAMVRLAELLADDRDASLRRLIARMYELRAGRAVPETTDDHVLDAALQTWTWYVECSIVVGLTIQPEDAFCPGHRVGRDKALLARYRHARASRAVVAR